jgi:hypothetical protein
MNWDSWTRQKSTRRTARQIVNGREATVNQIQIVGYLVDVKRDGESASAPLKFSDSQDTVLLFAFGDRATQLTRYRAGARVRVFGSLMVNPTSHRAAILVRETCYLNPSLELLEEDSESHALADAMTRFKAHASIAGVRPR